MPDPLGPPGEPRLGLGSLVRHPAFGAGKIVAYEGESYVVLFPGGEAKRIAFTAGGISVEKPAGDPALDRMKEVVREVLGEHGWLDVETEMGKRWTGGTMRLIPGKIDTQAKDLPLEMLFKKLIGIREKLRVLEQKINNHPALAPEDKLEMEGYITRCYGSLTSFNVLFAAKESQFKGQEKVSGAD